MNDQKEEDKTLFGATIEKLDVVVGDIVKLTIPARGHRWNLGRIQKLSAAIRAKGASLVVVSADTTLEVQK